jgi:hypothetical protein
MMPAASGRKQPTHTEKVLARLKKGPATHRELYRLGVVAHSRIAELRPRVRALGYEIPRAERHTDEEGQTYFLYRLVPIEDAA